MQRQRWMQLPCLLLLLILQHATVARAQQRYFTAGLATCAIDDHGALCCWGDNSCGLAATGSYHDTSSPPTQPISLGAPVQDLVLLFSNSSSSSSSPGLIACALLATGIVQCWGCIQTQTSSSTIPWNIWVPVASPPPPPPFPPGSSSMNQGNSTGPTEVNVPGRTTVTGVFRCARGG